MTTTPLRPTKLSVVGAGAVGTAIAYASMIRGVASHIALYDINGQKVEAEVADLNHGSMFADTLVSGGADIDVTKGSDVVIITAGARQKPGQSRLDLAGVNARILSDMMPALVDRSPNALFVLVTNPCDVLTVVAHKVTGLPTSRVFSTGTMLDTSRLRYLISRATNVAQRNVHASIIGEHGDSEIPLWSTANIGGVPILEWDVNGDRRFTREELDAVARDVVNAAYEVIEGKGATNYAIGLSAAYLVKALLSPEHTILPLSTIREDFQGIGEVALSMPTLVSSAGVKRTIEMPLSDDERTRLLASARQIRATLDSIGY